MNGADPRLAWALELVGASNIALGIAHIALWRAFGWTREIGTLSPLTARVFAVHTFFIAFVLVALGALGLLRADVLVAPSVLARFVCAATCVFWLLRLLAQPLVFDPVLLPGSRWRAPLRLVASGYFALVTLVHGWALLHQLE